MARPRVASQLRRDARRTTAGLGGLVRFRLFGGMHEPEYTSY